MQIAEGIEQAYRKRYIEKRRPMCTTIIEGSFSLLKETIHILEKAKVEYIIIGGWSPFLLNSNKLFSHPGTKDVDILFKDGADKYELKNIIQDFLKKDFLLSAKHDFQLLKEIRVKGESFIYNIDLLHPSESIANPDLFVDHLEFDIPISKYQSLNFMQKSIVLPESNILFNGHAERVYVDEIDCYITLMNEIGCLITKSSSVKVKKRPRDAYDIFLAINNCRNYKAMVSEIIKLKKNNQPAFNTLYGIREEFDKGNIHNNISKFCDIEYHKINILFETFFRDIGLDKVAQNNY